MDLQVKRYACLLDVEEMLGLYEATYVKGHHRLCGKFSGVVSHTMCSRLHNLSPPLPVSNVSSNMSESSSRWGKRKADNVFQNHPESVPEKAEDRLKGKICAQGLFQPPTSWDLIMNSYHSGQGGECAQNPFIYRDEEMEESFIRQQSTDHNIQSSKDEVFGGSLSRENDVVSVSPYGPDGSLDYRIENTREFVFKWSVVRQMNQIICSSVSMSSSHKGHLTESRSMPLCQPTIQNPPCVDVDLQWDGNVPACCWRWDISVHRGEVLGSLRQAQLKSRPGGEFGFADPISIRCETSMLLMEVVTVVCETSSLIWARHMQICFDILEVFYRILSVSLSNMEDRCFWDLNGEGVFQVKDVRSVLDETFLPKENIPTRWVKSIPIKVNVFVWKLVQD
ncbi:hypothetical protein Tco_0849538, partial [Tanacetum coccineum]